MPPRRADERLDGDPGDVVRGCCAVSETPAVCVWKRSRSERSSRGAVVLLQPPGPDAASGAELADLLEEVAVGVEEEGEAGGELVDVEAGGAGGLDIGEPVRQGEGQLLGGFTSSFCRRSFSGGVLSCSRKTSWNSLS